jgi:hypothetical protein
MIDRGRNCLREHVGRLVLADVRLFRHLTFCWPITFWTSAPEMGLFSSFETQEFAWSPKPCCWNDCRSFSNPPPASKLPITGMSFEITAD